MFNRGQKRGQGWDYSELFGTVSAGESATSLPADTLNDSGVALAVPTGKVAE